MDHDGISIARRIRAAGRAVALSIHTGWVYGLYRLRDLFPGDAIDRRRRRHRAFRKWATGVASLANMRVTVRGTPPKAPFLLVANHLSYMDIVAISSVVDCVYVSRGDIAHWPFIGMLCCSMETIFVDRERRSDVRRVAELIGGAYANGEGIVLFAEGTSTRGVEVAPFKPSLLEPAVAAGIPVHYAAITYRTPPGEAPADAAVCWWGDATFVDHLPGMLTLDRFEAEIVFGTEPIAARDRKELAVRLHEAISERFVPVTSCSEQPAGLPSRT